ncbi:hypothetical protein TVAG_270190 [Trichomonas vaginalis G3]|uniref:Uncharacterized protein n=1 Tax=Trichomonas vaginalis (strain ATCC PRA-98 / G3) TaxID=412133 RepID=A2GHI1_TRIV3|nr:hypothetical protein TVAGG3_0097450 [Trichomonas vaginalis G3]EAX83385.1 hypothetical protein TVAG_270190 [Trichomonas vaginalis G3]KAI5544200.1 hypothetical protein TVAGG3_0097450 [Trichomonas vaginalis G3]|eukprot:XP_001296315.1 hypothetical protein [Trichomonas vaginalis G3]
MSFRNWDEVIAHFSTHQPTPEQLEVLEKMKEETLEYLRQQIANYNSKIDGTVYRVSSAESHIEVDQLVSDLLYYTAERNKLYNKLKELE